MRREPALPERHQRVVRALRSGGPAVPDSLLRRLEAMQAAAAPAPGAMPAPTRPPVRRRLPLPRPALAGGVAVLVATAAAVVALLTGPGGGGVVQAAQLSALPSERPAPAQDPQDPRLLTRGFAGVTYPDWTREFAWRAVGERSDELDGRATATVFYRHTHHRIGYTVISGDTIDPPDDAERLNVDGLALRRFRVGAQDVVTFERNGRTCVLSGEVHDPDTLVKLAAWKGDGSVTF
jgi:hypothetical protein